MVTTALDENPTGTGTVAGNARLRGPSPATVYCAGLYVATRLAVALGWVVASLGRTGVQRGDPAVPWDSFWYLTIARTGYSPTLHPVGLGTHDRYSEWAFYPAYPLVVRGFATATRLPLVSAGYVVAGLLGVCAVRAVYALGAEVAGEAVGRASALLFAAWPGSVALSLAYSEGLFVTAAAVALVLAMRRRWWLAGIAGLVATASRPTGLALLGALAVAAGVDIARGGRRSLPALAAPVVAALGIGGFALYGGLRTGDWLVWRHAEALWGQRLDFSTGLVRSWVTRLTHHAGYRSVRALLEIAGMAALLAGLGAAARRWRQLPVPVLVYLVLASATVLGYSRVGTRPRMVLGVVPVFVALAAVLPRRVVEVVAVAFASTIALVTFLYVGDPHVLP